MTEYRRLVDGLECQEATNVVGLCTTMHKHMCEMVDENKWNSEIEQDLGLRLMAHRIASIMGVTRLSFAEFEELYDLAEERRKAVKEALKSS